MASPPVHPHMRGEYTAISRLESKVLTPDYMFLVSRLLVNFYHNYAFKVNQSSPPLIRHQEFGCSVKLVPKSALD